METARRTPLLALDFEDGGQEGGLSSWSIFSLLAVATVARPLFGWTLDDMILKIKQDLDQAREPARFLAAGRVARNGHTGCDSFLQALSGEFSRCVGARGRGR